MTWRTLRLSSVCLFSLLLMSCGGDVAKRGGFEGDDRPTFARDNPYEKLAGFEWREWSDEIFRGGDKPILLDLSPLWCQGCHLYDDVLFSNDDLARFIEQNFVPVRVDPDARPDLGDRFDFGGWPSLSVLTPDGDPIAGSGFDPEGVEEFLKSALERYSTSADSLRTALAAQRTQRAAMMPFLRETGELDPAVLEKVLFGLKSHFDKDYGGFMPPGDPSGKLLAPDLTLTLLREVVASPTKDPEVLAFLKRTLDAAAAGAVHDQLFGGFFRSTHDRAWSWPHFEKLLETQADAIELYLLAARLWGDDRYLDVARTTLEFVDEFFSNPDGLTYANSMDSALGPGDAGSFYTWTVGEVDSLLGPDEAEVVRFYYGIAPRGEVGSDDRRNTLLVSYPIEDVAKRLEKSVDDVTSALELGRERMRAFRLSGARPRVDSSAYAGPNLRFAMALLAAAGPFEEPDYQERALRIIEFFCVENRQAQGIPHRYDGQTIDGPFLLASQSRGLEACLRAFEITASERYLDEALAVLETMNLTFRNEVTGAYWDVPTTTVGPSLLQLKRRSIAENVEVAESLLKLFVAKADDAHRFAAERVLGAFPVSFASSGFDALPYAVAVNRLFWQARGESS